MLYVYKIHRWISMVCAVFFVILCVTGLILMFRMDIMEANRKAAMAPAAPISWNHAWDGLDTGRKAVAEAYPNKSIRAVFATPEEGSLVFRIQDKNSQARVRTMMRMGGERAAYYPESGMIMENTHGIDQIHPWVSSMLHTLHIIHTRMAMEDWGAAFLAFICTTIIASLLTGFILYGPFMRGGAFGTIHSQPPDRKWLDIHRFLGIIAGTWALVLTVSGILILVFSGSYRDYVRASQHEAMSALSADAGGRPLSLREALQQVQARFSDQYVISVELPSRGMGAYTFYLAQAKDPPATYFGQPVFVKNTSSDGTAEMYTSDIPLWIRAAAVGVDLHIHNHDLPLLRYLWAVWTILSILMGISAFIALWRKRFPTAPVKKNAALRHHVVGSRKPSSWKVPAAISLLTLAGLVLPLFGNAAAWGAAAAFIAAGVIGVYCWRRESAGL